MNRRNMILLVLLAIQVAIIAYVYRPGRQQTAPEYEFFAGLSRDNLQKLTITDDKKQSVVLLKSGKGWTIGSEDGFPVNPGKIKSLADKLISLSSRQLVGRTKSTRRHLKVTEENFNRRLTLEFTNGDKGVVYLGSSPNYKTIHARKDGEDAVYLVKDLSLWEVATQNSSWWQEKYLTISPEDLREVSLTNRNGEFKLQKDEKGQWLMAGAPPDQPVSGPPLKEFLQKISSISISSYLGRDEKDYGIKDPAAVLQLTTGKDKSITLTVGPKDDKKDEHAAKSSESPFYVTVNSYAVKPLLEEKREDLLAVEQKPAVMEKAPPLPAAPSAPHQTGTSEEH